MLRVPHPQPVPVPRVLLARPDGPIDPPKIATQCNAAALAARDRLG